MLAGEPSRFVTSRWCTEKRHATELAGLVDHRPRESALILPNLMFEFEHHSAREKGLRRGPAKRVAGHAPSYNPSSPLAARLGFALQGTSKESFVVGSSGIDSTICVAANRPPDARRAFFSGLKCGVAPAMVSVKSTNFKGKMAADSVV